MTVGVFSVVALPTGRIDCGSSSVVDGLERCMIELMISTTSHSSICMSLDVVKTESRCLLGMGNCHIFKRIGKSEAVKVVVLVVYFEFRSIISHQTNASITLTSPLLY